MPPKLTRDFWGKSREGFTPSPAGLRSWYKRYGRSFPNLQLVDTGDKPYLKSGDSLIDVILGTSGNTRWGWKTGGEPDAKSASEERQREFDPAAMQAIRDQRYLDFGTQPVDSGVQMDTSPVPWSDSASTARQRDPVETLNGDLGQGDEHLPPNLPSGLGSGGKDWSVIFGGDSTDEPCPDGQERVDGECPPPVENGKCDDQPGTVWDEALGQCVYPTPGPGEPSPGYRTYGMDPNDPTQPWDVDLSFLRDAPPFEFDYPQWVEPEAFAYAPYEQPDPFSYPEFAPPTGQQLLEEDPGYQFRLDEGTRRLQARAAAGGLLRTGRTLKELMDYGQNAASEEYQKAYNRRLREYQEGSGLAERAWDRNLAAGQWGYGTNLGAARDQWTLGRGSQLEGYGVNRQNAYQLARDLYAPQLASWTADQRARERAEHAKYGRQWQAYTYGQPSASTIYQTGATRPPQG